MSSISNIRLSPSREEFGSNDSIEFGISFRVDGEVRERFNVDRWTDAYNKHDNLFRIEYIISLTNIKPIRLIRKASFYWSRDPTLYPPPPAKKIWVMIVADDSPIIPKDLEEARTLLFDVSYSMMLDASLFHKGENKVYADIRASWGKHTFIDKGEINARSDTVVIRRV